MLSYECLRCILNNGTRVCVRVCAVHGVSVRRLVGWWLETCDGVGKWKMELWQFSSANPKRFELLHQLVTNLR